MCQKLNIKVILTYFFMFDVSETERKVIITIFKFNMKLPLR